jgi:hypothetical protein
MGIRAASWRIGSRRARLSLVVLLAQAVTARGAGPGETTKPDCGVNALFVLLRLEGRPVTLDRLESALPARRPDGYSMAELSAAAGSLGLGLEGVRFAKGDRALNRPAIAFLRDAKGGHFAVLRPVGTTGTMVQVIDPPAAPWIADYDRLFAARTWTGRILVPRDPWPIPYAKPLLAVAAGATLLAAARWRRKRPSNARRADVPATV